MYIKEEERIFDEVKITVKAGSGGSGSASFRREKFIEYGGPDGGDGGRGGNVILQTDSNINTLITYRFKKHFFAKNGESGSGKRMTGESGEHLVLTVPVGTQVIDAENNLLIADLAESNLQFIIAKGGKGGLGNSHFKSSTNQAPRKTIPPEEGEEKIITLKLKMVCDIGLIGMPNAGKSSFLAQITNAKPKIANYAFTTLSPNLGVCEMNYKQIIIADIPGLIEGASEGKGLGQKFLKHIERCKILFHLVDASNVDFLENYKTIRSELINYDYTNKLSGINYNKIEGKQEVVILTKTDLLTKEDANNAIEGIKEATSSAVFAISNFTKDGINDVISYIFDNFKS